MILRIALTALFLTAGGCAKRTLHPSFGEVYRANFGAQIAERQTRPTAPYNGDEAKRVVQTYYKTLGEDGGGGGGGGGAASPSTMSTSGIQLGSTSFSLRGR